MWSPVTRQVEGGWCEFTCTVFQWGWRVDGGNGEGGGHVELDAPLRRFITLNGAKVGRGGSNVAGKSMIPNDKHNEWRRGVRADEWICGVVNGWGV